MIDIKDKVILVTDIEQGKQVIEYFIWKGLGNLDELNGSNIGWFYGEDYGKIDYWFQEDLPSSKTILSWVDCLAEWKLELSKPKELSMPGNPITLIEPTKMKVSNSAIDWKIDTIYAINEGGAFPYLGKKGLWRHARPIQPQVTISMQEAIQHLAEKLNVSPDQIKIDI